VKYTLRDKVRNGRLYVEQGVIAGCAGGGFENICDSADILNGKYIGADEFSLSVYPASQPIFMELVKNGSVAKLMQTGATIRTAFCGPCFGAGDVPANNGLSIRHSTRNFPNREGAKITNGQIASVALMDARSIAATAANQGYLTSAEDIDVNFLKPHYFFDSKIYENRVYDGVGKPDTTTEIKFGPGIVDWPAMESLTDDLVLKVVSVIHDPVTTTDELIPSGETSSYRSNPLGLAEFTLSRKDPAYVGRAKEIQLAEKARQTSDSVEDIYNANSEIKEVFTKINQKFEVDPKKTEIGSVIYAVKPGDGSAREQAASCQKVLGGLANIAKEYATKRYRSNLINWGMLPFLWKEEIPFKNGDYLFVKDIKKAIENRENEIKAYVVNDGMKEFTLTLGELTDDERNIILKGCLINYYRN
jgi:aconitate hydratase